MTVGRKPVSSFELESRLKETGPRPIWRRWRRACRRVGLVAEPPPSSSGRSTGRRSYGRCRATARPPSAPRWSLAAALICWPATSRSCRPGPAGCRRARSRCAPAFLSVGLLLAANFARNARHFSRRGGQAAAARRAPSTKPRLHSRTSPLTGQPAITDFCRVHGVDLRHARFVAGEALALFNAGQADAPAPQESAGSCCARPALGCNIVRPETTHIRSAAGRDLYWPKRCAVSARPTGWRWRVSSLFSVSGSSPNANLPWLPLEEKLQNTGVSVGGALQVAEALDFSCTRSTTVQAREGADGPRTELTVGGPQAGVDAQHAAARGGLGISFSTSVVHHRGGRTRGRRDPLAG